MKNVLKIILLCCVFISGISAQFHETIPTSHWIYRTVEKLQTAGYLHRLTSGDQPYTRQQIAEAYIQDREKINQTHNQNILSESARLKNELAQEIGFLSGNTEKEKSGSTMKFALSYDTNLKAGNPQSTSFFRPQLTMSVNNHFSIKYSSVLDQDLGNDPNYTGESWSGFAGYQEQCYISYTSNNVNLLFGRDYVKWGYGKGGRLLISDNSRPFDMLSFKIRSKKISLHAFTSQLDKLEGMQRYLSATRFEINPLKRIYLGFGHAVLYSDTSAINFALSNPMSVSYAIQHNDDTDANTMLYLDFACFFNNRSKFYGELLIDDIQIERKNLGDLTPNEFGFILGFETNDILFGFDGWFEFSQVRNRIYNNKNTTEKYLHRNMCIGHAIGNDFQRFQAEAEKWLREKLRLTGGYFIMRSGEGSVREQVTRPWLNGDYTLQTGYSEKIPFGVVETTQRIYTTIHYEYNSNFQADILTGFEWQNNVGNVEGKTSNGMFLTLHGWIDIDKRF